MPVSRAITGAIASVLAGGLQNMREAGAKRAAIERAAGLFQDTGTDEGTQFAAMLREDPKVANQMAEQFGGFGPLLNGILARKHQDRIAQLGVVTEEAVSKQFADTIRPTTDATGNAIPRDPEFISATRNAYESYARNAGVRDPALLESGWGRILAEAGGSAATQAEDVANQERAYRQQLAAQRQSSSLAAGNIRLSSGLQSRENIRSEAASAEEFDRRSAIALAAEERKKFISDATNLLAADPTQEEYIRERSNRTFAGTDSFEVNAQIEMGKKAAVAKAMGTTAPLIADGFSPYLAKLALQGKAYKDPLTQIPVQGEIGGEPANNATLRKGLYELLVSTEYAAEKFAEKEGGTLFTGTIQSLFSKTGGEASPYFAVFDMMQQNAQSLLTKARTGAALNEREMDLYASMMAKVAQVKFRNGKLDAAARARFESLLYVIETEHMGRMGIGDAKLGRKRMRDARSIFRSNLDDSWKDIIPGEGALKIQGAQSRLDDIVGGSNAH